MTSELNLYEEILSRDEKHFYVDSFDIHDDNFHHIFISLKENADVQQR